MPVAIFSYITLHVTSWGLKLVSITLRGRSLYFIHCIMRVHLTGDLLSGLVGRCLLYRYHAVTQAYNNCAETPWWWSYELFCLPVSAIALAHDRTVMGSVALRKGPRRFCPYRSDRCRALMLTCRNSPLWQRCERCNNVMSSSWPPWLDQWNSVVIT